MVYIYNYVWVHMVLMALLVVGRCSIYKVSHIIKIKWDVITTLNVADLLHWTVIIFQYNPRAERSVCAILLYWRIVPHNTSLVWTLKEHFRGHFFCSIEDEEVAVHGGFWMQEPDFYCNGIFEICAKMCLWSDVSSWDTAVEQMDYI
jgi:hypothetical protein